MSIPIQAVTGTTYTLAPRDTGTMLRFTNGSAVTVTAPNSLRVGWNAILRQAGAGIVTVVAGTGAVLNTTLSPVSTVGQYSNLTAIVETNVGDATANFSVT